MKSVLLPLLIQAGIVMVGFFIGLAMEYWLPVNFSHWFARLIEPIQKSAQRDALDLNMGFRIEGLETRLNVVIVLAIGCLSFLLISHLWGLPR